MSRIRPKILIWWIRDGWSQTEIHGDMFNAMKDVVRVIMCGYVKGRIGTHFGRERMWLYSQPQREKKPVDEDGESTMVGGGGEVGEVKEEEEEEEDEEDEEEEEEEEEEDKGRR
ncbi:uncharacterized protein PADG_08738 [Paracoccidioides brasiliensis Pb18]|uniref:Uncharacterized protein n=1 Tax=Paracoccidioides brasiliensis (strain Pb18) TaxID=502780 RepID=C1GN99_PARBD|nr:uncharacterized protein PADG_08738 [Paracoccidioides brasiliensis Pb18]EEH47416.2 hypothetical protein PADG_08738 [Paracoccidioides brasiliensis Pb18]